jgi:hypothetical protein
MAARHRFPRSVRPASALVSLVIAVALGLLLNSAGPARAGASSGTLTCFAVDVSGSNLYPSDGEPPSDPGPIFVRQQVSELFGEVLAAYSQTAGQQVGVVTFGTGIGADIGPVTISDTAARSRLATEMSADLQPSVAEQQWTNWVDGLTGCEQMFQRSGAVHGMVAILTDGFPQGPPGSPIQTPAQQLSAISPIAAKLWSEGIPIQPVLYGAGAGNHGPAYQDMSQLAAMGHGHLVLAATSLELLHSALSLASLATGLPLGGTPISVDGQSGIGLDVPANVATAVLVALRSSNQVEISISAPGQNHPLASAAVGSGNLGLVVALAHPPAGTYEISAYGNGSAFAADLLLFPTVLPAPAPTASASPPAPTASASPPAPTASASPPASRHGGSNLLWLLILVLVVLALLAVPGGWLLARRRRPRGALVVWRGPYPRTFEPDDLKGRNDLAELLQLGEDRTGWTVEWTRQSPAVTGPDGETAEMQARVTEIVDTTPPITLTWLPDGVDAYEEEPPGRADTVP